MIKKMSSPKWDIYLFNNPKILIPAYIRALLSLKLRGQLIQQEEMGTI